MQKVSTSKQQSTAGLVLLVPAATACTGLILCSVFNNRAHSISQELIGLLDGSRAEFRRAGNSFGFSSFRQLQKPLVSTQIGDQAIIFLQAIVHLYHIMFVGGQHIVPSHPLWHRVCVAKEHKKMHDLSETMEDGSANYMARHNCTLYDIGACSGMCVGHASGQLNVDRSESHCWHRASSSYSGGSSLRSSDMFLGSKCMLYHSYLCNCSERCTMHTLPSQRKGIPCTGLHKC